MSARAMTGGMARTTSSTPTWWIVFLRESHELWLGGKAPVLLLVYTVLLGILTYVMASNSELSLIPPQEMVYETLKGAFGFALFICMVVGADSISGERERNTLESTLLTPTSRQQIVIGKFLAGVTVWPAAMAIAIPYLRQISQGNPVFQGAVFWGIIAGTILVPPFCAIGMLASFWSNSNKTSYFTALALYVLFLVPTTLPGRAQTGLMGALLQQANPIAAAYHFLSKVLVNNRTFFEFWPWLVSSAILAIVSYSLLFLYAAPGLRLEAGRSSKFWKLAGRLVGAGMVTLAPLIGVLAPNPAQAQPSEPAPAASQAAMRHHIGITIDMDYVTVKAGDPIEYHSIVTNHGTENSPPLCLAMNIVNLNAAGDIVDPEDWSPQRTQYLETVAPGASDTLAWHVNAILDGDYLVYMVVIPEPPGKDATSLPVASSGIHLTVTKYTKLNPAGVLPYAIGGPVILALGIVYLYRRRRHDIDTGAATA